MSTIKNLHKGSIDSYDDATLSERSQWARVIDFIPQLWLQSAVRGSVDVFWLKALCSKNDVGDDVAVEESQSEYGEVVSAPAHRRQFEYKGGSPIPFDRTGTTFDWVPLREMYSDARDSLGVRHFTIKEIGIMHDPLSSIDALDGATKLAEMRTSYGNRSRSFTTVNLNDLRTELLESGGFLKSDQTTEVSKRALSSLATNGFCTDTGITQKHIPSHRKMVELCHKLQSGEPLQDVAVPRVGEAFGQKEIRYKLAENDELTALE